MRVPWERVFAVVSTAALVVSMGLFVAGFVGRPGGGGWQDLARIAGGLLLLGVAGFGFGLALLAGRLGREAAARGRLALEAAGAGLGLAAVLFLAGVAVQSWTVPLVGVVGVAVLVMLAGLATVPARWRAA